MTRLPSPVPFSYGGRLSALFGCVLGGSASGDILWSRLAVVSFDAEREPCAVRKPVFAAKGESNKHVTFCDQGAAAPRGEPSEGAHGSAAATINATKVAHDGRGR